MKDLQPKVTPSADVIPLKGLPEGSGWRLEIPPGPEGSYRLAQLDDYTCFPRQDFPWSPPLTLRLHARASEDDLPGTWGFGLWNDPFSLSLGVGGGVRRFPALPNAAWFFHASPENHLSFQSDKPAQGFLAQTFRSPAFPTLFLALGSPFLPLLAWSQTARLVRKVLGWVIQEDSEILPATVKDWHTYTLHWTKEQVRWEVAGEMLSTTNISPAGRLGLVIWIDNQYAAFPPSGRLKYGTLAKADPSWIEIKAVEILTRADGTQPGG